MARLWVCLFAFVAATGIFLGGSADRALAVSIEPAAHSAPDGFVALINCKTGNKNCETSSGLQKTLQDKLKKGGGEVGGGEQKCQGPTCGNCAADPTNCGDAAAKKNGAKKGAVASTAHASGSSSKKY